MHVQYVLVLLQTPKLHCTLNKQKTHKSSVLKFSHMLGVYVANYVMFVCRVKMVFKEVFTFARCV